MSEQAHPQKRKGSRYLEPGVMGGLRGDGKGHNVPLWVLKMVVAMANHPVGTLEPVHHTL